MSTIRRINPRRPYQMSPAGVKRIVLGDASGAAALPLQPAPAPQSKPARQRAETTAWHMAVVQSERGALDPQAREAIAAAAILAKPAVGVMAVILGGFTGDRRDLGADVVAVFEDHEALASSPERDAALVSRIIATYAPAHIFIPDSAATADLGRRLIAKADDTAAARVVELDGLTAVSSWSGGAALAASPLPRFVLLSPGAVDPKLPFIGEAAAIEPPQPPDQVLRIRDLGTQTLDAVNVALEEADFIVSAGNGVENTATLKTLAAALGAAVGASRVAVDDGKFARNQQVGATGKTVVATTYMAVGISGAVQHLQGIKDCRHVIAINRDSGAPITGRADLSIIGDAEGVMQALLQLIAEARSTSKTEAA